jgi:hypothetical protein
MTQQMQIRPTHRATEAIVAGLGGSGVMSFKYVSGGTPDHIFFANIGAPDMANADYVVQVQGETVLLPHVDESTITPQGFDVLHAALNEVLHITIHGKIAGMPAV